MSLPVLSRSRALGLLAAATLTGLTLTGPQAQATDGPPPGEPIGSQATAPIDAAGPTVWYTKALTSGVVHYPLDHAGRIDRTPYGYAYRSDNRASHIVLTRVTGGIKLTDTTPYKWMGLSRSCHRISVRKGIGAVCSLFRATTPAQPTLLEMWPRGGNDTLDAHTLSAGFQTTMESDAGNDTAHFGAGRDFFNGYTGRDVVTGGGGADWIRSGDDADTVSGGDGDDLLVGDNGNDLVKGDGGNDRVYGSGGDDTLYGGSGNDGVFGADGNDRIFTDDGQQDGYIRLSGDAQTGAFGGNGTDSCTVDSTVDFTWTCEG